MVTTQPEALALHSEAHASSVDVLVVSYSVLSCFVWQKVSYWQPAMVTLLPALQGKAARHAVQKVASALITGISCMSAGLLVPMLDDAGVICLFCCGRKDR